MIDVRRVGQPRFLTVDEVMFIHHRSLAAYGGREGVREAGLVDSAVAQARAGFGGAFSHAFPFEMAAAYAFHIAMNHPFIDGNKRTAFGSMEVFLFENGYELTLADELGAGLILEIIEQHRSKEWIAEQLAANTRPRTTLELRDFFATMSISDFDPWAASAGGGPQSAIELLATTNEAIQHIPLLGTLVVRMLEHREAGRMTESNELAAQCMALIAMFRAAENAGYEW